MENAAKIFRCDVVDTSDENKSIRFFYDDKEQVITLRDKKGNSFDVPYAMLPDVSHVLTGCVSFTHRLVLKSVEEEVYEENKSIIVN